ncbi:MAG: hypothetical protein O3A92_15010, partial [Verrucomicrobia bacterium]|nr:hypothetical protein [Verrucomicrobiota bacterium]
RLVLSAFCRQSKQGDREYVPGRLFLAIYQEIPWFLGDSAPPTVAPTPSHPSFRASPLLPGLASAASPLHTTMKASADPNLPSPNWKKSPNATEAHRFQRLRIRG